MNTADAAKVGSGNLRLEPKLTVAYYVLSAEEC